MYVSLLTRIVLFCLGLLFIFSPIPLQAAKAETISQEIEPVETVEAPNQMTQKQMNDLFGEDPYLGQTSYLQSPDGFTQRDKSK